VAQAHVRPGFLGTLRDAYGKRGKNVALLTGDTLDLFYSGSSARFVTLEQLLYQDLHANFLVLRMDAASGVSFYDRKEKGELLKVCEMADAIADGDAKLGNVKELLECGRHQPLPALELLQGISESIYRLRAGDPQISKPLCTIIRFAGSIFPAGDFDHLAELDRQRLVTFLSWINDPRFNEGGDLIILLADTRSEVNRKILALPTSQHIEIPLPDAADRERFVSAFVGQKGASCQVVFEPTREAFVGDTAGLRNTAIQDLLEVAHRTGDTLSRKVVLEEVNRVLEAELGDLIKVKRPDHTVADIIGHPHSQEIFRRIFARCEDPESAIPAMLVSGPNGGGKTFQLEAFAAESGRLVIELAGLRGMYFGQTDRFFEQLLWQIRTFGKILILVDEAHTAFGSVHKSDTHETEKRLSGNIIKMMSDRRLLGKVVWALMTSRPDELDPDVKSRCPIQVPIFDLEGEERKAFVAELFKRKKLELTPGDLALVLEKTEHYSSRDFDYLTREIKAAKQPVCTVLEEWSASTAIVQQRRMQSLIASEHCSYPKLLPQWIKDLGPERIREEVILLKSLLHE
jgi:AAA+ superfamily predicted ATPase